MHAIEGWESCALVDPQWKGRPRLVFLVRKSVVVRVVICPCISMSWYCREVVSCWCCGLWLLGAASVHKGLTAHSELRPQMVRRASTLARKPVREVPGRLRQFRPHLQFCR